MTRSPLARRYARALLELAQEQGRLGLVRQDLAGIAELCQEREDLLRVVHGYSISNEARVRFWRSLLEGRADELTLRFVLFLIHKGRANLLPEAIREFEALYYEMRGIQTVEIVSAHPMQPNQIQTLIDRFAQKLGREVRAVTHVDAALLGGFQVRVDDLIYDYSVNHQLERLHRNMLTA